MIHCHFVKLVCKNILKITQILTIKQKYMRILNSLKCILFYIILGNKSVLKTKYFRNTTVYYCKMIAIHCELEGYKSTIYS